MLKRQLVHESQRRATKNRGVATRLQPGAATQFVRLLVACSLCTYTSGDGGMRKASAWMLEKGIHTPSPSPDLIPAGNNETLAENLHGNWNIERGHFMGVKVPCSTAQPGGGEELEKRMGVVARRGRRGEVSSAQHGLLGRLE